MLPLLVSAAACAGTGGSKMVRTTDEDWSAAREVAEAYVEARVGSAESVGEAYERVPFLFRAGLPDGSYVLVHQGRVLEDRSLKAFGDYLAGIDALEHQTLEPRDFQRLLSHFDTFPPTSSDIDPEAYVYRSESFTALEPKLEWSDSGGNFSLYYVLGDYHGESGGAPPDTPLHHVIEWTLVIPPTYHLEWHAAEWIYDDEKDELTRRLPGG